MTEHTPGLGLSGRFMAIEVDAPILPHRAHRSRQDKPLSDRVAGAQPHDPGMRREAGQLLIRWTWRAASGGSQYLKAHSVAMRVYTKQVGEDLFG